MAIVAKPSYFIAVEPAAAVQSMMLVRFNAKQLALLANSAMKLKIG